MRFNSVAIFGDSWAYSSFKKLSNFQEMQDNTTFGTLFSTLPIQISNYAKQGGTNIDTINSVKLHNNYDLLIVFQTDPIRQCFKKNELEIKEDLLLPDSKNFEDLCETLLNEFYVELGKIKTPILLIGGCTKLCTKYIPDSIITLPMSWTELMTPGYKDNYFYWTEPALKLYDHARKQLKWDATLSDFRTYEMQIQEKNYIWHNSNNFSWCHAAKPAYEKMFEKIKEILNDSSQTSNRQAVLDSQAE